MFAVFNLRPSVAKRVQSAGNFDVIKILLCPKSLENQGFSSAVYCILGGPASLRLGHGAALICHRHIIHSCAAASLPQHLF
jgi:hypothetical protein